MQNNSKEKTNNLNYIQNNEKNNYETQHKQQPLNTSSWLGIGTYRMW